MEKIVNAPQHNHGIIRKFVYGSGDRWWSHKQVWIYIYNDRHIEARKFGEEKRTNLQTQDVEVAKVLALLL